MTKANDERQEQYACSPTRSLAIFIGRALGDQCNTTPHTQKKEIVDTLLLFMIVRGFLSQLFWFGCRSRPVCGERLSQQRRVAWGTSLMWVGAETGQKLHSVFLHTIPPL